MKYMRSKMIVNTIKKHADKVAHVFAGMAVGLTAIFMPMYYALLLVFLVGALKEVRDHFGYGAAKIRPQPLSFRYAAALFMR